MVVHAVFTTNYGGEEAMEVFLLIEELDGIDRGQRVLGVFASPDDAMAALPEVEWKAYRTHGPPYLDVPARPGERIPDGYGMPVSTGFQFSIERLLVGELAEKPDAFHC